MRPAHHSSAWLFLVGVAALSSVLAGMAYFSEGDPVGTTASKPRFNLRELADPMPVKAANAETQSPKGNTGSPETASTVVQPSATSLKRDPNPTLAAASSVATTSPSVPVQPRTSDHSVSAPRVTKHESGSSAHPGTAAKEPSVDALAKDDRPATKKEPVRPVPADPALPSGSATAKGGLYGTKVSGQLMLGNLAIPLPPGEWQVAADLASTRGQDVALVQENGPIVVGATVVSFTSGANGLGYEKSRTCTRPMLRGVTEKNDDFGDQSCWSSTVVRTRVLLENEPRANIVRALRGELQTKTAKIRSDVLVDTAITLANMNKRVTVLYYFNPESAGIEPKHFDKVEDSDWHSKNLGQHPEKQKYLRERLLWAAQAFQKLKQNFATANQ